MMMSPSYARKLVPVDEGLVATPKCSDTEAERDGRQKTAEAQTTSAWNLEDCLSSSRPGLAVREKR